MEEVLDDCMTLGLQFGAKQVEVYGTETTVISISFENRTLKEIIHNQDRGVGIRALLSKVGSAVGSSYTMSTYNADLETAVREALSLARAKPANIHFSTFETNTSKFKEIRGLVDQSIIEMDLADAAAIAHHISTIARTERNIRSFAGEVVFSRFRTWFRNSLGVKGKYESTLFRASVSATARRTAQIGSAYDAFTSHSINLEGVNSLIKEVAEIARSQLGSKIPKSGKIRVLFGPDALEELSANLLRFGLAGDLAQKKQSWLAGKAGKQIASKAVTLKDDGTVPGLLGSKPFDDEGHRTEPRFIIYRGVLKSFLFNLAAAGGEHYQNTGNGIRVAASDLTRKYSNEPRIVPHNLIFEPGRGKLADLISETRDGIFARSLIGGHTGNPVTGEFSVTPQMAYRILRGEIAYPIRDSMITGSMQELMNGVLRVGSNGSNIQSISGDSSFSSPPVIVEGLRLQS